MKNWDSVCSFISDCTAFLAREPWAKYIHNIPDAAYEPLAQRFAPDRDWAEKLVKTAKDAGRRYITLVTGHHDGFSLYDTRGWAEMLPYIPCRLHTAAIHS